MAKLSTGDHVRWNTSRGRTSGTVVDLRSKDFTFDDQHFTPSEDDPRYIVESDKTGARAAHKRDAPVVQGLKRGRRGAAAPPPNGGSG